MATILPSVIATAASKASVAVTTWPPRTMVSTRASLMSVTDSWRTPGLARGYASAASPVRLLLGHGLEEEAVVLGLAAAEEVPALPYGQHLVEVDARHHQLVPGRRRPGQDLAVGIDDRAAPDQLHAVLDARLRDADYEAGIGIGARAHAEVVEIEGERRERRVVADDDELGALERQRAVALRIAPVLADRDTHLRARRVEDPVARVAVSEVVRLEDLGEAVGGPGPRQVDLPERPAQPSVPIGEEGSVEVLPVGLLAEADVHGHPALGRPAEQGLERLGRHLGLEELVEVGPDALGEIGRQRHLGIGDQLDLFPRGLLEQAQHALDDLLAARALVVGAHLGGGDLHVARHGGSPLDLSLAGARSHRDTPIAIGRQASG